MKFEIKSHRQNPGGRGHSIHLVYGMCGGCIFQTVESRCKGHLSVIVLVRVFFFDFVVPKAEKRIEISNGNMVHGRSQTFFKLHTEI